VYGLRGGQPEGDGQRAIAIDITYPGAMVQKTGRKIGLIGGNRRNRPPPINKPTIFNLKFDFFGKNPKNMKKTREDFKWNGAKLLSNT
jgi:hypothetical protein